MNEFVTSAESYSLITEINKRIYLATKRLLDVILSLIGIIISLPIFIVIVPLVKLDSKGPVFFYHKRIGKNGSELKIYKFRTMVQNAGEIFESFTKEQKEEYAKNFKLENDPRITKIGKFLRKTSLDELPQIFNILKGEMTLIGPRPVVNGEIDKYGDRKGEFLSVTPGLTGWWACSGRSNTTYEERIELELYYVKNMSFLLDVKCFFKTIISVLNKEGAE